MAADDILIGIDLGTTALKAAAFGSREGRPLAGAVRRLPLRTDADGTREQDTAALRGALGEVFVELRQALGSRWARVAGLGLAAQGGSGAIVDRHTAAPFTPMMLWNDSRAAELQAGIAAAKPASYWRRLCWRDGPGAGLARLRWLQREQPALFAGDHLYAGAGEFLYFLMTGVWRQDACNAHQIGCYNVAEDRLDPEPLAVVDVPLSFVAALREGHETHPLSASGAALLGLPAGMPVAGPYMDHEAGYLSAAGVAHRPLQCSLGTAWVGNFIVPEEARGGSPIQLVIPAPAGPGRLVVQPLLTGNVAWDWGLTTLVDADHRQALAGLGEIFGDALFPPPGLMALPWLTQANALWPPARGAGAFFGVNAHTAASDLLRALALGLVFEFFRVFEALRTGALVDAVVLGGGASKGVFFRTLFAALFDPLPVFSLADEDLAGARGTLYGFDRAVAQSRAGAENAPDPAVAERAFADYARYAELYNCLYGGVAAGAPYRPESHGETQ